MKRSTEAPRPSDHKDFLLHRLVLVRHLDVSGDLPARGKAALKILGNENLRHTQGIETWWDNRAQHWITWDEITKETLGSNGTREGAALEHCFAIADRLLGPITRTMLNYEGPRYCVFKESLGILDRACPALVAQFLRAVEDPAKYEIDSAEHPQESPLNGAQWLADNPNE